MKKVALSFLMVLAMTMTAGCGVSEKVSQLKDDFSQDVMVGEEDENQLKIPTVEELQLEELNQNTSNQEAGEEKPVAGNPTELVSVELFFASADGKELVPVKRDIPKEDGIARATIETLLEGPDFESGLLPTVPAGTQLLDINVVENKNLCIIDFSEELASHLAEEGINEEITVYSIANTLCQFPSIEEVEFRVEGQNITTLKGATDLSTTVSANAKLVQ